MEIGLLHQKHSVMHTAQPIMHHNMQITEMMVQDGHRLGVIGMVTLCTMQKQTMDVILVYGNI